MAADDRKQRIQEHLKATSGNESLFSIKKTRKPPQSTQLSSFSTAPTKETQPTQPTEVADRPEEGQTPVEVAATAQPARSVPGKPKTFQLQDFRKRNIMDHVKKTSVNFGDFSLGSKERQKQILEHLRKSQG